MGNNRYASRRLVLTAAISGILYATAPSVMAADFSLEEVVVTARKTEESVQDVPVAISAFSADDLTAVNITKTSEIAAFTPSLFIEGNAANNLSSAKTTIRGQVQADSLSTLDPSVGWYIDDVYLARTYGTVASMFDIARVEVLKGPQGTLYGRNTTGGAIKLITTKAEPGAGLTGFATAGYGNLGAWKVGGAVNVPIVEDKLAIRVSALTDQVDDGYGTITKTRTAIAGAYAGNKWMDFQTHDEDVGQKDIDMYRIGITFEPTSDLRVLAHYERTAFYANAILLNYVTKPSSFGFYEGASNAIQEAWNTANTASLTTEYDISEDTSTKLVLAYRDVVSSFMSDVDGSTAPINYFLKPFEQDAEQTSAEWQIYGDAMDGQLEWVTGLYYFEEKGIDFSTSNGIGDFLAGRYAGTYNATIDRNISRSAFVQGTLHLTDDLSMTGGLRYTYDRKPVKVNSEIWLTPTGSTTVCRFDGTLAPNANLSDCTWSQSANYEYMSWTAGINYQLSPDVLTYLRSGSSNRAGGQNLRGLGLVSTDLSGDPINPPINTFEAFEPENVTDIELGMKGQFFDNSLQVNAALYHIWYDKAQTSLLLPTSSGLTTFVDNTSSAQFDGIELEAKWVINESWMLQGSLSKIDWRHDNTEDYANGVPAYEYTVRANYLLPLAFADVVFDVNYAYRGEFLPNSSQRRSVIESSDAVVEDVGLWGARASMDFKDLGLTASLWGQNLADEEYTLSPLVLSVPANLYAMGTGMPRTYGVDVTYKF